jgi:hypothetical protein
MISSLRRVFFEVFYRHFFKEIFKPLYWRLASSFARSVVKFTPTKIYIKRRFKREFGYKLNLSNPKTLNEKIQWKKIFDHRALYVVCSDKYLVRNYVALRVGEKYLIPMHVATTASEEIFVKNLPKSFIIKSSHASGHVILVKNLHKCDKKEIYLTCKKWLKTNYFKLKKEWQYKYINPRIIIEKYLQDEKGQSPNDYKFHCFYGKVAFIQIDVDRFTAHKRSYYDASWSKLPFQFCKKKDGYPIFESLEIQKPSTLAEMISVAEKLSKDFDYVRIDLYEVNGNVYFGEITFSHGSGFEVFFPQEYDKYYGEMLCVEKKRTTKSEVRKMQEKYEKV